MLTTYLIWTLAAMSYSIIQSARSFNRVVQARRLITFRHAFPDHPMVLMVDEKIVAEFYAKEKSDFKNNLQVVGVMAFWPLTIPAALVMMGYEKVAGINKNMAPNITIDHYKIREEEGF